MNRQEPETVTKLDAARRQLATAIELWFNERDTVSVYTLSHAAYEVIHDLGRKTRGRDLLFDSIIIKDEYRNEFVKHLKKPANFFKHGQRGPSKIEFYPLTSEMFILFSILGLELAKVAPKNDHESVFLHWLFFNRPNILTEKGRKEFADDVPVDILDQLRRLSKREFFEIFMNARMAPRFQ